mmetsp:Transcript_99683/g.177460  ORF Transcript_99683/g.177460 Transcript_99683/m.177460 type:complete len:824 (+) Transcript_99683:82-2553(+)
MPNLDLILPDTSELPALVKDVPRSEDEKRQLLALLEAKSSQMKDCTRLLRQEKFKSRRQAVAAEPEEASANSEPALPGPPVAELQEEISEHYSALRAKLQAASTSDAVDSLIQQLQAAASLWSQEMRAKLEPIFEFGRHRLAELQESAQDELQSLLARAEALETEISECSRPKSLSCLSTEDSESNSASRDASLARDAQKELPALASSPGTSALEMAKQQLEAEKPEEEKLVRPAKGKGKGGGKAPPPKAATKVVATAPANNGLNIFQWQVSKDDDPRDPRDLSQELFKKWDVSSIGAGTVAGPPVPVARAPLFNFVPEDEMPQWTTSLEHLWKKREVARSRNMADVKAAADHDEAQCFLDEKTIELLGITLKRHQHQNKARLAAFLDAAPADAKGMKGLEVILDIKRAILRCSFDEVCVELLSVIRTLVRMQDMAERPVEAFMNEVGAEEFHRRIKCPLEHRLVYELCKVPQIAERLECMLFHISFQDNLGKYSEALQVHRTALEMLNRKRETIQRFFITALKMGQSLNRQSKNASKAPNGFSLASLEQLSQTKSTKLPRMSLMHFAIALMSPEDASTLFNEKDVAVLQKAAVLRTHKVYTDCVEIAQGLSGVQQICHNGQYVCPETGQAVTIERMARFQPQSMTPNSAGDSSDDGAVDDDDHFHKVMEEFVEANREAAEDLGEKAFNLILMYKELAIYFDDMRSVYPPPKSEKDARRDLVEVFCKFAVQIQLHREQAEQEKLREQLSTSTDLALPGNFLRRRAETSPDLSPASGMSPPLSRSGEDTNSSFSGTCHFELQGTPEAHRKTENAADEAFSGCIF